MSYTIGIDIGGTKVLGGVVNQSGEILQTARKDTPREGDKELIQVIADVALELAQEFPIDKVGIKTSKLHSQPRKFAT